MPSQSVKDTIPLLPHADLEPHVQKLAEQDKSSVLLIVVAEHASTHLSLTAALMALDTRAKAATSALPMANKTPTAASMAWI